MFFQCAKEKKKVGDGGYLHLSGVQIPEAADEVGLEVASAQIFRWLGNFLYENFSMHACATRSHRALSPQPLFSTPVNDVLIVFVEPILERSMYTEAFRLFQLIL